MVVPFCNRLSNTFVSITNIANCMSGEWRTAIATCCIHSSARTLRVELFYRLRIATQLIAIALQDFSLVLTNQGFTVSNINQQPRYKARLLHQVKDTLTVKTFHRQWEQTAQQTHLLEHHVAPHFPFAQDTIIIVRPFCRIPRCRKPSDRGAVPQAIPTGRQPR